jgi:hypothetical protein
MQLKEEYHLQLRYEWFASHTSTQPADQVEGEMYRDAKRTYFQIAYIQSILEDSYLLTIDQENKLIQLRASPELDISAQAFLSLDLDSLLATYAKAEVNKRNPHLHQYRFSWSEGTYEKAELLVDPLTFQVPKIILFFATSDLGDDNQLTEKPRVEISISLSPSPRSHFRNRFSLQHYLIGTHANRQLRPAFESYQFENFLQP